MVSPGDGEMNHVEAAQTPDQIVRPDNLSVSVGACSEGRNRMDLFWKPNVKGWLQERVSSAGEDLAMV